MELHRGICRRNPTLERRGQGLIIYHHFNVRFLERLDRHAVGSVGWRRILRNPSFGEVFRTNRFRSTNFRLFRHGGRCRCCRGLGHDRWTGRNRSRGRCYGRQRRNFFRWCLGHTRSRSGSWNWSDWRRHGLRRGRGRLWHPDHLFAARRDSLDVEDQTHEHESDTDRDNCNHNGERRSAIA